MRRNNPSRFIAAGIVASSLLMCGPSIGAESREGGGARDRETTQWALPSQSMRDVAREKTAKREAAEKAAAEARLKQADQPDRCISC